MKKIVFTFGLIGGAVMSVLMIGSLAFHDQIGFETSGYIVGYTSIVLACLLIFFGIRSYRENVGGGKITFARGCAIGVLIALVSSLCYVVAWEIAYFNFMPDFMDKYGAHEVAKLKAAGATAAAVQAKVEEMKRFKVMYANPLFNAAMTFIEPFPVGLVVAVVSAGILRKKAPTEVAV